MTVDSLGGVVEPVHSLEPADPADRGITTMADRVIEKTASQAAAEVVHVGGLRRHLAGRALGGSAVRSHADVDGHLVGLSLDLAVDYPQPIRSVTREVRAHVIAQVERICGLRVEHLDITVASLRRADLERRRVQ